MTRRARLKELADSLSGGEGACPIPSSHDRMMECHFFLNKLIDAYHEPDPLRYCLHAFIQAYDSTFDMLLMETQRGDSYAEFREQLGVLAKENDVEKLRNFRNVVVHRESLVADSVASIGLFLYGRLKLAFKTPVNPLTPSLQLLGPARNGMMFVDPHRSSCGEEIGVERVWRLKELGDVELVQFCAARFAELSGMVEVAHEASGHHFPNAGYRVDTGDFQLFLESEVFPEVTEAWEGEPSHFLTGREGGFTVRASPSPEGEVLYTVEQSSELVGWLGGNERWPELFSLLVYSIDGEIINTNTAGFVERRAVIVKQPPSQQSRELEEQE